MPLISLRQQGRRRFAGLNWMTTVASRQKLPHRAQTRSGPTTKEAPTIAAMTSSVPAARDVQMFILKRNLHRPRISYDGSLNTIRGNRLSCEKTASIDKSNSISDPQGRCFDTAGSRRRLLARLSNVRSLAVSLRTDLPSPVAATSLRRYLDREWTQWRCPRPLQRW